MRARISRASTTPTRSRSAATTSSRSPSIRTNSQTVYLTNTSTYRSTDGGKTLVPIKGAPGGDDYHTVWINPRDPRIVALASDQGATISVDGGATWSSWYNQPTAQMYHVNADNRFPYWVCGGQQESGSACVRSRGDWGADDRTRLASRRRGRVRVRRSRSAASRRLLRRQGREVHDERTGQTQEVSPIVVAARSGRRVVRTEPLAFDPFDQRRLYFGSNVVFATDNGGQSWRAISPDLTRKAPGRAAGARRVRKRRPAARHASRRRLRDRAVVRARAERSGPAPTTDSSGSPATPVRTGKTSLRRRSPRGARSRRSMRRTSTTNTAFVAVNRFRLDDLRPYVYVTRDGGATWSAHRRRPAESAGQCGATRSGRAASALRGDRERRVSLVRRRRALAVAAAQPSAHVGARCDRSRQRPRRRDARTRFLDPRRRRAAARTCARARSRERISSRRRSPIACAAARTPTRRSRPRSRPAQNPPDGAIVDYALASPAKRVVVSFYDGAGRDGTPLLQRRCRSPRRFPTSTSRRTGSGPSFALRRAPECTASFGICARRRRARCSEDLPISAVPHDTPRVPEGPLVVPGRYTVRLDVDGQTLAQHARRRDGSARYDLRGRAERAVSRSRRSWPRSWIAVIRPSLRRRRRATRSGRRHLRGSTQRPPYCSTSSTAPTRRRRRRPLEAVANAGELETNGSLIHINRSNAEPPGMKRFTLFFGSLALVWLRALHRLGCNVDCTVKLERPERFG